MRELILTSFACWVATVALGCASANEAPAQSPSVAPAKPVADKPAVPAPSDPAPTSVAEQSPAPEAPPAEAGPLPIPRQCEGPATASDNALSSVGKESAKAAKPSCFPAPEFVHGLCSSNYPGVALVMFHPESPWRRGYLKGETKAWTSAPATQQEDRLKFNEEVLVLQSNNGEGGALAGQGDSFFALRWNGSCVKLTEEEITGLAPWRKVAAPVTWAWLDDNVQEALLEDGKVAAAQAAWKKECRKNGATSPRCNTLAQSLTDAVVARVQSGAALPDPTSRPSAARVARR